MEKDQEDLINKLQNALIESLAKNYRLEGGMKVEQSYIHARTTVECSMVEFQSRQFNSQPAQPLQDRQA